MDFKNILNISERLIENTGVTNAVAAISPKASMIMQAVGLVIELLKHEHIDENTAATIIHAVTGKIEAKTNELVSNLGENKAPPHQNDATGSNLNAVAQSLSNIHQEILNAKNDNLERAKQETENLIKAF